MASPSWILDGLRGRGLDQLVVELEEKDNEEGDSQVSEQVDDQVDEDDGQVSVQVGDQAKSDPKFPIHDSDDE